MIRALNKGSRIVAIALVGAASTAGGQLSNVSAAATGVGGAFTARAQGYNAVYWNPANLGMPGNQGFSLTMLGIDGQAGIRPIDMKKVSAYSGIDVPKTVREQWMLDVEQNGGQNGGFGGGITEFGLSLGHLGFQLTSKVSGDMNLAPGAIEAMLFGNYGRYDSLRTLNLAGSSFQTAAYTTGAVSYGMGLPMIPLSNFAVGVTAKYTVGHALIMGLDNGSALGASDLQVNFPMVLPDSASLETAQNGVGVGLDLGAAWTIPGFRFGASLQNVVNTFKWDTTKFASRSAVGVFTSSTNSFDVDSTDKPYSAAPAALREKVAALKFKPVIALGVSYDGLPGMTVSADMRQQVGDGIEVGPKGLIAAGVEARWIPFIPLRGGIQMMSGGFGVSGGVGVHLLGFEMGVAGYLRTRDGAQESGGTINLFSIRP